ncbi:sulfurtransferase [Pseudomonas eucalypticola]|uniref:Sulfurtransferase n=1 Tax=Pseudomonas eucalypticola TaxID=2599595 RepID=A0A7D5H196_9PSED|nr:rhodanese-like domain-containing protein [Pseudomonas eucalypticola]QKZ05265.1 sulfurtransferase [Pseudomonas eucalypticola]
MTALLVNVAWLAANLHAPHLVLLDATVDLRAPRFDGDYQAFSGEPGWRAEHLPGARHADLLMQLHAPQAPYSFAMPATAQLALGLQGLGVDDRSHIVIYDRADGFWAARLWWMLRSVGVPAAILDGGLQAWRNAGQPIETGPVNHAPATAAPTLCVQPGHWASLEQVRAVSEGRTPGHLICALSPAVFDGSATTRYSRRGHIPNSLNRPARHLFDDQGRYHPPQVLAERLGVAQLPQPIVLYCGGGISAAASAFALTLLGRHDVTLYDGSLQQWSAAPALPMTTGAAPA